MKTVRDECEGKTRSAHGTINLWSIVICGCTVNNSKLAVLVIVARYDQHCSIAFKYLRDQRKLAVQVGHEV